MVHSNQKKARPLVDGALRTVLWDHEAVSRCGAPYNLAGERYEELLNDIFKRKQLAEDFSLYVHRPTATDPSFAPQGCDSFYVLAPVPNLDADIDWSVEGKPLQDRIVRALSETMLPGLEEHITADFFMTPQDFQERLLECSWRWVFYSTVLYAVRMVSIPQQGGRTQGTVPDGRGYPSGRGNARRAVFGQGRGETATRSAVTNGRYHVR